MKKLILILPLILASCAPAAEEAATYSERSVEVYPPASTPPPPPAYYYPDEIAPGAPPPNVGMAPPAPGMEPYVFNGGGEEAEYDPLEAFNISAESIARQLATANMAFAIDEGLNIKNKADAELVISLYSTQEELTALILQDREESEMLSDSIPVSKTVSAILTAPHFEVFELSTRRQPMGLTPTRWEWELFPLHEGTHEVTVTVLAHVIVDDERIEQVIKTYERTLVVEVEPEQKIWAFIDKHWQWLASAIFIPLAIYAWRNRRRKKKE